MTVDKIKEIKCFILDMDGTIYLGNELFDFTKDFLNKVEETGREYYFLYSGMLWIFFRKLVLCQILRSQYLDFHLPTAY